MKAASRPTEDGESLQQRQIPTAGPGVTTIVVQSDGKLSVTYRQKNNPEPETHLYTISTDGKQILNSRNQPSDYLEIVDGKIQVKEAFRAPE
ncbi:MAG: hypothetical protein H6765_06275 [Candidatus Peribacteria bacterium]|nr:MAG: hypothetical protein H6765_06275 [Candidatus Peribacteria bacterium]